MTVPAGLSGGYARRGPGCRRLVRRSRGVTTGGDGSSSPAQVGRLFALLSGGRRGARVAIRELAFPGLTTHRAPVLAVPRAQCSDQVIREDFCSRCSLRAQDTGERDTHNTRDRLGNMKVVSKNLKSHIFICFYVCFFVCKILHSFEQD